MNRWLCLHLPRLAIEAARRQGLEQPVLAIVIQQGAQRIIHQCDDAASELGIRKGMVLNAAYALAPHLEVRQRDSLAEKELLELVAAGVYCLSSRVSMIDDDAIVAEIGASRLLKPAHGLKQLRQNLALELRMSLGNTPAAALLLARAGHYRSMRDASELNALPLQATALAKDTLHALAGLGIDTLGGLQKLPRSSLARRFGPEIIDYLDRLSGAKADPLSWYTPPDAFQSRIDLPEEAAETSALLFAIGRLLKELSLYLRLRDRFVHRFTLGLVHAHGMTTTVQIGFMRAESQSDNMLDLVRERFTHLQLQSPVRAIELTTDNLCRRATENLDLFTSTTPEEEHAWARLIERLRSRLGEKAISTPRLKADYRPEKSYHQGIQDAPAPGITVTSNIDLPTQPVRPFWELNEVRLINPEQIIIKSGPERIESGWWDGLDAARDYYIASMSHRKCWIYHELRPPFRWFIHGWY